MSFVPYPPKISDAERADLVQTVKDWGLANGLAIRPPPALIPPEADPEAITAINAPVTLFPSPFPQQCFQQARDVQKAYNALYAAISGDEEFLAQVVKEYVC
jgi:glutathione synthase